MGLPFNLSNIFLGHKRETISKSLSFLLPVLEKCAWKALDLDMRFVHSGYLLFSFIHASSFFTCIHNRFSSCVGLVMLQSSFVLVLRPLGIHNYICIAYSDLRGLVWFKLDCL